MKYNIVLQTSFCIILCVFTACVSTNIQEHPYFVQPEVNIGIIGRWKLQSVKINGRELTNITKKEFLTLEIKENSRFSGYSGCNGFSGHVEIGENDIYFENFLGTQKGCPGNPSIENIIFDALKNVNNYYIEKEQLFLRHDNDILIIYIQDNSAYN